MLQRKQEKDWVQNEVKNFFSLNILFQEVKTLFINISSKAHNSFNLDFNRALNLNISTYIFHIFDLKLPT